MKRRLHFFLLFLMVSVASAQAQDGIPVVFFTDEDSLTIYVPSFSSGSVVLSGVSFAVVRSDGSIATYSIDQFPAFRVPDTRFSTPICLRLFYPGQTNDTVEFECASILNVRQEVSRSDLFWRDSNNSGFVTVSLLNNGQQFGLIPAGQTRVETRIPLPPPTPTQPPIDTPTAAPTLVPSATFPPAVTAEGETTTPSEPSRITIVRAPESNYLIDIVEQFNRLACNTASPVNPAVPSQSIPATICVEQYAESSGVVADMLTNRLQGQTTALPDNLTIFQPSVSDWLRLVNFRSGQPVFNVSEPFNITDRNESRATTREPIIIAIWESRLRSLEQAGLNRNQIGWRELRAVQSSPNGWCDFGVPNCRRSVLYGQTDPNVSSTALSTLIGQYYVSVGSTGIPLNASQVSSSTIQNGVRDIQQLARHYSFNTVVFREYLARGSDYVDFVALDENSLIYINRGRAAEGVPPEPLVALYPSDGTFYHERPMGILNAPWVSEDERLAAQMFVDFVLTPEMQRIIMSNGFRPANPQVTLDDTFWGGCDIVDCGVVRTEPTIILPSVSGEVVDAIQDSWDGVKRQADILLVIDISGSMSAPQVKLDQAKAASLAFIDTLTPDTNIGLILFDSEVRISVSIASVAEVGNQMRPLINAIPYGNPSALGDTSLYDALRQANTLLNNRPTDRIRAIVLLSDGRDTRGNYTIEQALMGIENSWQTSESPFVVLPIAYGADADIDALGRIARSSFVSGLFRADELSIQDLLRRISTYF
jgi:Ca-activated chloride channel homolog